MPRLLLIVCTISALMLRAAPAGAAEWKPIDPAHLALTKPKVDPAADAEALLWEVRVADDLDSYGNPSTSYSHYIRVKVFTDRGRDAFATVDIPYFSGIAVTSVAARTVRADGTIVELKGSDIYERTIVKMNDLRVKTKSFAVPALERGVIVEYQWRESHRDSLAANLRLRFSREIPVHEVRYYVRPLSVPGYGMVAYPFNAPFGPPEKQRDGFAMLSLTNVPADIEEEYALPQYEQRPWVFIGYEPKGRGDDPEYARKFSKELFDEYGKRSKPNADIRALATQAVTGAASDRARVTALVALARQKVRRVDVDTANASDFRNLREAKNAADVLKRGAGTGEDVLLVFLALAQAVNLDARVAAIASRSDLFPRSLRPHPAFTPGRIVAIRSGNEWLFADPTNQYAPAGDLPWQYEDQRALIGDGREAVAAMTPPSAAGYSVKKRTGTFRLLEDGTLEGEARIEYTGHWGEVLREQEDQDTAADREKYLRELVSKRLPGVEISDVRIEHVADSQAPYANAYRIRVPGYAQRTGTRLAFPPAVFQKGTEALFAREERKSAVHFPFPWTEEDVVTIDLPPGFAVEDASPRRGFDVGGASYEPALSIAGSRLEFRRTLAVAKQGIVYDAAAYAPFRAFFKMVHGTDAQAVVLRRKDGAR